ncbi:twin-arginine translocase subunit TatC [Selenihalanaerobacter shriftii]|uniref:Sec-independent protein translocase protein TatC n=1 Tax=Selenihalanaerobacter shriftii TaxID=142842 RepID=A0A1T4LRL7_9FIRM|nr:twin-arginine translocase subunit TatC [Selenihalanaerobacter shriftii]SJZ57382.1 sec-independent protein translocase protein TatC [Selenihalanaerobacter shriftii]
MSNEEMSLVDHLTELRKRLIIAIGVLIVASIGSYIYSSQIIEILTNPVGKELVYLSPPEAFFTQVKVSFFAGFLISLPIILYNIWRFILPGLEDNEKNYLLILVPLSYLFFVGGVAFGFFVVIPFGIKFFLGFTSANLEAMFSLSKYISFIVSILIPFGLVFELPLLITLLVKMNLITSKFLTDNRKYVIVATFLFAAILTPPDIISQTMMALPLIVLYEGSIIVAKIIE